MNSGMGRRFSWATIAQLAAAFTALGGLALHLIGATVDDIYYRRWGLDAALFPRGTDQTIILGYRALLEGIAGAAISLVREWWPWLLAYGLFLAAVVAVAVTWQSSAWPKLIRERINRHSRRINLFALLAVSVMTPIVAVPFAVLSLVILLALPISAGEQHANKRVRIMLKDFEKGCGQVDTHAKCITVVVGDRQVATGFLIGASTTHVAVYEVTTNRVRVARREDAELTGAPDYFAYPDGWPVEKRR